ncbi:MAG: ASCH domain-containing protein [Syntrophales bacterium LBB04]|nr:ASCH domain-containing protein [Syntrophales bacterium LBB04]
MKGLLVRSPWIEKILAGRKTWEIRGSNTNIRGRIGLIKSGSGLVVGTWDLVGVEGPLSLAELRRNESKHQIPLTDLRGGLPYERTFAWVLRDAKPLGKPVPYEHLRGAIIWVKLTESSRPEAQMSAFL